MTWPAVVPELDTLDLVLAGRSLARYGDGELHLCDGRAAKRQPARLTLQHRLRAILMDSGECLVGIPNLCAQTPKATFWEPFRRQAGLLADRPYVSAFVTRPDSAPWIDTPDYWHRVTELWHGRDVTLVTGGRHGLRRHDLLGAGHVREIHGPPVDAWRVYPSLLERVRQTQPERVLICLGPAATVMAVDLCALGIHAIDAGHLGLFWRKHLAGAPLTVTAADKAA